MSATAHNRPAPVRRQGCGYASPLAMLALLALLPTAGLYAEDDTPRAAAPTAESLLTGARTAEADFKVSTGFHVVQNTIQVDTLLG
ncbi:MAG: hypothetical protein KDI33_15350, partial [Halioglobus sp.]|nr:hypothetical protein [Halioglobus sp.]